MRGGKRGRLAAECSPASRTCLPSPLGDTNESEGLGGISDGQNVSGPTALQMHAPAGRKVPISLAQVCGSYVPLTCLFLG